MASSIDSFVKEALHFVEDNIEDIDCPICLEMLNDPHQVTCCGNHFCGSCIRRVRDSNGHCPFCKEMNYQVFADKNKCRFINGLKVYCTNEERGCQWKGDLKNLSTHLSKGKREGECQFEEVKCQNKKCQDKKQRCHLDNHEKYECPPQRQCPYCGHLGHPFITEDHYEECIRYPAVVCPNRCQNGMKFPRSSLDFHILKECPLQRVECPFSWAGCTHKPLRKDSYSHTTDLNHMSLLAVACEQLKLENEKLTVAGGQLKIENEQFTEAYGQLARKLVESTAQLNERTVTLERQMKSVANVRKCPILPVTINFGSSPVHVYTHTLGQHISVLAYNGWFSRTVFLALHKDDFNDFQPPIIPKISVKIGNELKPLLTDTMARYKKLPHDVLIDDRDADGVLQVTVSLKFLSSEPTEVQIVAKWD